MIIAADGSPSWRATASSRSLFTLEHVEDESNLMHRAWYVRGCLWWRSDRRLIEPDLRTAPDFAHTEQMSRAAHGPASTSLFRGPVRPGDHEDFGRIAAAEWEELVALRDGVDAMWQRCRKYLDRGFAPRFRSQYYPRSWELRTASLLLEIGAPLVPAKGEGPDFLITPHDGRPRTWIECVTPTHGSGPDAVIEPPLEGAYRPDERAVMLRYTSVVRDKALRFAEWRAKGIVSDDDACIIAVNPGEIMRAAFEFRTSSWCEPPWILRTLYGIGDSYVTVPIREPGKPRQPHRSGIHPQPYLIKNRGEDERVQIGSRFFLEDGSAPISAVIFSREDILNAPEVRGDPAGRDFLLVHNLRAAVPLAHGWLGRGEEWWPHDGELHRTNYRAR